jgi:hypothetical protein
MCRAARIERPFAKDFEVQGFLTGARPLVYSQR